jgi:hypothetical protein
MTLGPMFRGQEKISLICLSTEKGKLPKVFYKNQHFCLRQYRPNDTTPVNVCLLRLNTVGSNWCSDYHSGAYQGSVHSKSREENCFYKMFSIFTQILPS